MATRSKLLKKMVIGVATLYGDITKRFIDYKLIVTTLKVVQ
jgi:hypothetical protein